ncbi:MAG: PAS domain S-box protein [Nitrospirota bacterium]
MEKDKYIDLEILRFTRFWGSFGLVAGAVTFTALVVLDYFVTPENFTKFLLYRISVAFLMIVMFFINRKLKTRLSQNILFIIATILISATIEVMILSFGGHQSTYYAGMVITIIFLLGFISPSFKLSVFLVSIIYSLYLFPILIFDTITNKQTFISNNAFLIATAMVSLAWRYLSHKGLVKELSLQYELNQERSKLEVYSTQLEQLVEERTKELSSSEQKFRGLFDNANDGVVVLDKDGIIINVNKRFCELHSFEKDALIGTPVRLLEVESQDGKGEERMDRILKGESFVFETEHYRKDGSKILLEVSSKEINIGGQLYIQSFNRDVTERKRLQEQLFQSQKMESIGVLAGGIAHDFNNILTAILGHAELLHEYSDLDASSRQKVKTIENSARKAGQMVSKLLSFARKGSLEILPISLNNVINDTIELVGKMMANRKISVKMELDEKISAIYGDSNQIEQVVMNLILNSADAMHDGGTITVSTFLVDLQSKASRVHPLLNPGKYAVLSVSDTGTGITDEVKNRMFEPFFTTKETGKGTGLGLAMVYGIVKEHKGVINVESQLGRGTTFEIYLPASDSVFHKVEKTSDYSMAGQEKILVIDDESDVLNFVKEVLDAQGYSVIVTDNPIYALDIFKQIHDSIDLVITDIIMPLVNGRELIKHFKMIKPEVKVIGISGYDAGKTGRKDRDIDAFIRKPFESIYLLSTMRRVLDSEVQKGVDLSK